MKFEEPLQPSPEETETGKKQREIEKPADTSYFSEVSRYFNIQRENAKTSEEFEEGFTYAQCLQECQLTLERLASPKRAEKMQPQDVSMALSELAGNMAGKNPNIESNSVNSPKLDEENEKEYLQTRKIFMESCKKIFPGTKADIRSDSLQQISKQLESFGALIPEMTDVETVQLLKEDPKKLAEWVDGGLYNAGHLVKMKAWLNYSEKDMAQYSKTNSDLAEATEMIYRLQLLRDQLQKQIYGRADMPPSDARKIDEIRSKLKGEKPKTSPEEQPLQKPKLEESPNLEAAALRDKKFKFGKDGSFAILYTEQKSLEEVKKIVTPEMKQLMLEKILQDIDYATKSAEEFLKKNQNHSRVGKKTMGLIVGAGITAQDSAVYQKVLSAAEGRIVTPAEIARMPVVEYLRQLGYDLTKDKKRAELLRKFTDIL